MDLQVAGNGGIQVASTTCWTNLSGHPWRPARSSPLSFFLSSDTESINFDHHLRCGGWLNSSLIFLDKIHSGTVSLEKDKYLTPAPNLRRTRKSHDSQYTRYILLICCSDALKNSFFHRTIQLWNRLPSLVVSSKTNEELKGLI